MGKYLMQLDNQGQSSITLNRKASLVGYAVISVRWHKPTVARSFDISQKYAEKIN